MSSTENDRDELLSQLLSLPPTERESFLRRECGSNEELEGELRSLLRVHDKHAGTFLLEGADPMPGTIGRYPILQVLGRGGMGTVYLAIDPELDRKIAIKVVSRELTSHLSVERLRQEARLLASVSHPNLATVYSLETAGDRTFLTLELVTGSTLSQALEGGPFPVREALIVFRQIASAIAAIHRRRIVHRDLSPNNIFITDGGLVKVLDFGLSTLVFESGDRPPGRPASLPNQMLGTPGYMSPELIRGERPDHRADLWSFGCLLFEALTGDGPFRGENIADTLVHTIKERPDFDLLPRDLPVPVRDLIESCLEKDIARRHDSIETAIAILERPLAPSPTRHPGRIVERRRSSNLPRPLSSFVGRRGELSQVRDAITRGGLVTLKGMGGAGKTRLAIEAANTAAERFPDGVWFTAVAPLESTSQLVTELAKQLGAGEQPQRELRDTVIERLRPLHALLILDNAEHLLREVAALAYDILSVAPSMVIIATSRQSLALPGEQIIPVPPFPVTGSGGEDDPAVQLFIERAREIRPDFALTETGREIIADICRHLDGLPLAIELAAVRTRSLPLADIATRLRDRFSLLAQRNPMANPHHQTLGLSMDHSYELLSEEERTLFRRLAIFPESWSLSAAETICANEHLPSWRVLDLLDALMDHSLVEADTDSDSGQHRYRMLETVREYAVRRLGSAPEVDLLRQRHREFYLQLAEEAILPSKQRPEPNWAVLDAERRNMDLAIATSALDPDPVPGLRLASALGRHWVLRRTGGPGSRSTGSSSIDPRGSRWRSTSCRGHSWGRVGWLAIWMITILPGRSSRKLSRSCKAWTTRRCSACDNLQLPPRRRRNASRQPGASPRVLRAGHRAPSRESGRGRRVPCSREPHLDVGGKRRCRSDPAQR
ncbi:MAG: protein kinase [Candidatus Eisenbacteria bacterium]